MRRTACMHPSEHFIILLVDARQLDYSCNQAFFRSLVKHPSDGSKNSDVGHAWIYLCGRQADEWVEFEGGHSGELGRRCPKYFEGVMDYYETGDPNPIRYLWAPLNDGYFQTGNGGHKPTFAIKIDVTTEQFQRMVEFVQTYDFSAYSLTERQCCSFVQQIAALAGLTLEMDITMQIQPTIRVGGEILRLRSDPCYAEIQFACPEVLECSMIQAVEKGKAEYALDWYLQNRGHGRRVSDIMQECYLFPLRLKRALLF